ncbi:MAG: DUF1553 domain-containing protein, partial [Planctomycetaceae bacterium]|nr:DUF1553 domain-containing protein [Planctomycetaceae bacterium]
KLGQRPTHPELLDWLAADFMEHGWSLKHLHRLILNSNAWQQQVRNDPQQDMTDPDNLLYGGARLLRLDAEAIRDSILQVSGKLNDKPFGPAVPVMADEVGRFVIGKENLDAGRPGAVIDLKGEEFRRSVYVQIRRSRPLAVLDTFDRPQLTPNCEIRKPTTSATQSLMLMNSDLIISFSRMLAQEIAAKTTDADEQINSAWRSVYGRLPEESERGEALHFVDSVRTEIPLPPSKEETSDEQKTKQQQERAVALLCQMLLSSNEFLYVD